MILALLLAAIAAVLVMLSWPWFYLSLVPLVGAVLAIRYAARRDRLR